MVFPAIYIVIPKITMCIILSVITALTVYLDIYRNYNKRIKGVIDKIFGKFLRFEEESGKGTFSGSSYMALGLLISCLLFSKGLAITSWLILIISDCFAALIGIKFGTPLSNGKSYAGAFAFFISSIFISITSYFMLGFSTNFLIIIISSFLTSIAEFFAKDVKINDNLLIPLIYSLSTVIISSIV